VEELSLFVLGGSSQFDSLLSLDLVFIGLGLCASHSCTCTSNAKFVWEMHNS